MNQKTEEKLSKLMSFILRHKPDQFGIILDESGYCDIKDLLSAINSHNAWNGVTTENINQVVNNCSKQRYKIEGNKIKANYGHSSIKVKYNSMIPPDVLYHGTNVYALNLIMETGLKSMGRQYVHMSVGLEFAELAGKRRGELVILQIDAKQAHKDGVKFYYTENDKHGVWLSDYIPAKYLTKEK